jgi:HSP20 family molecular chaperone IbpA
MRKVQCGQESVGPRRATVLLMDAAAAGVDKKDIKLSVDGDVLNISVQKDESKEVYTATVRAHELL